MIRAAKINPYLKLMETRGVSAAQVLANAGIDSTELLAPERFVNRAQYCRVIMNLLELSGDSAIAFSLGEFIEASTFGILGYAMAFSTTLGEVVRTSRQCQDDIFGTTLRIDSMNSTFPGYELSLSSSCSTEALRRFETEEFLSEGIRLMTIMTGVRPVIDKVTLAYSKPHHSAMYDQFFDCPVEFDAPRTTFRVRAPDFETKISGGNAELQRVCVQHCQQVMQANAQKSTLRDRLRELFLARPSSLPDLAAAAAMLGMSERSFRRRLQADDLSFQTVKDEFRLELSQKWLCTGGLPPKEVAHLLGYTSPSTFSRAFKAWTGKTIRQATKATLEVPSHKTCSASSRALKPYRHVEHRVHIGQWMRFPCNAPRPRGNPSMTRPWRRDAACGRPP